MLAHAVGWRGTMLASAGTGWLFAVLLRAPCEAASTPIRCPHLWATIVRFLDDGDRACWACAGSARRFLFARFAFNGLQAVFIAYFVTWLDRALGYDLVAAGALFSTVIAIAIPCRILWGWLGSFYVSATAR